jgi:hypothetical protein
MEHDEGYLRKQFEELNAMERQQDMNLWTFTALFSAAQGVFLLALLTPSDVPLRMRSYWVGGLGFILTIGWLLTTLRAYQYVFRWVERAKHIETDLLQVTPELRVWDKKGPWGPPNRYVMVGTCLIFMALWFLVSLRGFPPF